jgi:hypothetical protein
MRQQTGLVIQRDGAALKELYVETIGRWARHRSRCRTLFLEKAHQLAIR